ncbi:MAG: phosphoribosylanthranilate isomerase [Gammaproteobacteria bacterium]|nr:phosphoribosylanthranilate isomerase [Gammaproteobacteria bacterium]
MFRTRVKICGITRAEDMVAAQDLGADAIGLVFYEPSPRFVSADKAMQLSRLNNPFVTVVGLFVDATEEYVRNTLDQVQIDLLQFHGNEDARYCESFGLPYIKAITMKPEIDLNQCASNYNSAQGLLLDTYQAGLPGGSGKTFDWQRVPTDLDKPIILAGGLNPENVARGISEVKPFAVDVSGGVESSKGIKDRTLIENFMKGVACAERNP